MAEKKKVNKNSSEIVIPDYGKLPPQAVELEEAVLGAIMLEKEALIPVSGILKPDSFYKEAHKEIYQTILDLNLKFQPVDILTVTEELRKKDLIDKVGGPYYISSLTTRVASAAHIEYHARIIQQKYIQRELIHISGQVQEKAFDESEDVLELLDFAENRIFSLAQDNIKKDIAPIRPLINEVIKQIEEAGRREDGLSGIPSGFTGLDRITSGWQRSDLVIIAARPSMGKTAFVLSLARNVAMFQFPVVLFSLEMSSTQLVKRLIVSETELSSEKIKNGKLDTAEWQQLEHKIKDLSDAPIFIDDTPALPVFELRSKCRRLKEEHDIQLVIIDYLQLMTIGGDGSKGNREQEVSMISRSLKAIAKELNVPIIALSQLNRSVETRGGNKRPQLSDLRESGAIEQDADMVLFIHRPEYYGQLADEEGNSLKGIAEIIIAKHRNGAVGDFKLKFQNSFAKFSELDMFLDSNMGELAESETETRVYSSKMNSAKGRDDSFGSNTGFDNQVEAPF